MHINISVKPDDKNEALSFMIAGVLHRIAEMTVFLNHTDESYKRLGSNKAPKYITWSRDNRSQLIRIPAAIGEYKRAELRSPDPLCNPYIAFALIIYAALEGLENKLPLCPPADINLYELKDDIAAQYSPLPSSLKEAVAIAQKSDWLKNILPESIIKNYCR